MAVIVAELLICTDCAHLSANGTDGHCGDCTGETVCEERMRTIRGIRNLHGPDQLVVSGDEFFFSHRICEGCGSVLSGDRIEAVIFG